ncbi:MAG: phosphatidylserine decarboxylase [Parvibaculaceae bacterium]|nr:phosphatidylserine decarboxylase [Parvibaculaceae bacterium]
MDNLTSILTPIHREGYRYILMFAAAAFILFFLWTPLGWAGVVLTLWCVYFFRDPERVTPRREGIVVSPADGIVSLISEAVPPPELGLGEEALPRVSVFMNVFNCHVNRAPVPGIIKRIAYRPGKFINAKLDKASEDNERNSILIERPDGAQFVMVQIAGLVARRIVCEATEASEVAAGGRVGIIRFGSRVDVYMPTGMWPCVEVGQTMVAGETVLADPRISL